MLNGFGGGGSRYAANPGLTLCFRHGLPETGCLSQGLPYGKRFAWRCPPKTVKHPPVLRYGATGNAAEAAPPIPFPIFTLSCAGASCGTCTSSCSRPTSPGARPAKRTLAPSGKLNGSAPAQDTYRSEEHTSELQSLRHLVCRLLL